MLGIGNKGQCFHQLPIGQLGGAMGFHIHPGHLLTLAQVFANLGPVGLGNLEGHAHARTAPFEPEHKAGSFHGPPVPMRIDAQPPVHPAQQRPLGTLEHEAGPPDQRSVTKDPGREWF